MHCDPRVLMKYRVDDEPIWRSEPYEREAWEAYWYRKFYTETLTGQLMVLRPDEPFSITTNAQRRTLRGTWSSLHS